jgi:acyl-coenzyme A synthetase/AMP-(fatty) acid ligase
MDEPETGAWLAVRGVRAGDVVAICAPDTFEATATRNAIASIGADTVTLNPLSPRPELHARLCGSGAHWLVTTPELFAQKLEVAARPSAVMGSFLIDPPADGSRSARLRLAPALVGGQR